MKLIGLDFPCDEEAYEILLMELEHADCDAVFLDGLPVTSCLWECAREAEGFRQYSPEPPAPWLSIRFEGTFQDYMKRFSSRHRHNLRRRVSKFAEEAPAPVTWKKYTTPEDVPVFLARALEISRKTYQWKVFARGLSDVGRFEARLRFTGANGWFRSYVWFCGETPVAFIAGWQVGGCYDHHEIGYDPAFQKWGRGHRVVHVRTRRPVLMQSAERPGLWGIRAVQKRVIQ